MRACHCQQAAVLVVDGEDGITDLGEGTVTEDAVDAQRDGHGGDLLRSCVKPRTSGSRAKNVTVNNAAGLKPQTGHLLAQVQDGPPDGAHLHLEERNGLEEGSVGLVVERCDDEWPLPDDAVDHAERRGTDRPTTGRQRPSATGQAASTP
ncbi:Imm32 family immunity protein [Streptomyces sp. NPDC002306]